jgi:hypothetical protein
MAPAPEPPVEPARDGLSEGRDSSSPAAAPLPARRPVTPSGGEAWSAISVDDPRHPLYAHWQIPQGGFDSFREAAVHLRRPFTPAAVKFKVQSTFGPQEKDKPRTGALIDSYIDARLVIERLNLLVPHLWSGKPQRVDGEPKYLLYTLTVDGIARTDVGEAAGFSKDLLSDALKRTGVHFGIGVSLYAVPQMKLFKEHIANGNLKAIQTSKGQSLVLTDKGDAKLREGYTRWLETRGVQAFGPPLDHGDREGHMDTPEAAAPDERPSETQIEASERAARDFAASVKAAA